MLKCFTKYDKNENSYVYCLNEEQSKKYKRNKFKSNEKKKSTKNIMPPKKRTIIKATADERKMIEMYREMKLKEVRKGTGAGRPKKATVSGKKTRAEIAEMRDKELKRVKKALGVGAGRPTKAITQMRNLKDMGYNIRAIRKLYE